MPTRPPKPRPVNRLRCMEIKKAWEILLSPIPVFRPSHCPIPRISNAASPRQVILYAQPLGYDYRVIVQASPGYNSPTQTSTVALLLWNDSKLRSLKTQTVTFRKRLFPFLRAPYKRHRGLWDSIDVDSTWPLSLFRGWGVVGAKVQKICETAK